MSETILRLLDALAESLDDRQLRLVLADAYEDAGMTTEAKLVREAERVTLDPDGNLRFHSQWKRPARREAAICYRLSRTLGTLRPRSKQEALAAYREMLGTQERRFAERRA